MKKCLIILSLVMAIFFSQQNSSLIAQDLTAKNQSSISLDVSFDNLSSEAILALYEFEEMATTKKATRVPGDTALHVAARAGDIAEAIRLINLQPTAAAAVTFATTVNENGDNFLHVAARKNQFTFLQVLQPILKDRFVLAGYTDFTLLMKKNNNTGNTALHTAVVARNGQGVIVGPRLEAMIVLMGSISKGGYGFNAALTNNNLTVLQYARANLNFLLETENRTSQEEVAVAKLKTAILILTHLG